MVSATLITPHELRKMLNSGKNINQRFRKPLRSNLNYLLKANQFEGLEWFVSRLDSIYNHYKVESHMILTKSLFLICNYCVAVGFARDNQVVVVTIDDKDYYVEWKVPEDLMSITWLLLDSTKDSDELSYRYEDYRQATRAITDNLSEDHQPFKTWKRIVDLTNDYFNL